MLVVTELFNIAVNDFDSKKSVLCNRVVVVPELVFALTLQNVEKIQVVTDKSGLKMLRVNKA